MARYALDASTVLAYILDEERSAVASEFLDSVQGGVDELVGPGLLLAECTAVIREKVYTGGISNRQAEEALELALSLPIRPVLDSEQHRLALRFSAGRQARKAYDDHYLAVAALFGAELVTIDGGMHQGAVNFKIPARLLR
jgi:predicted nucleic acid-binding protein